MTPTFMTVLDRACSGRTAVRAWTSEFRAAEGRNAVGTGNQATAPYLVYRDEMGRQQMTVLASATARLTIGRGEGCDLHFYWDHEVSRLHAQLERIGVDWVLVDDGLSRNGTYVNGERLTGTAPIAGRRRHPDRFHHDFLSRQSHCRHHPTPRSRRMSSPFIRCRRLNDRSSPHCAVRTFPARLTRRRPRINRLRTRYFSASTASRIICAHLFGKFGVEDLPQNQKRARLVELAFRSGLVSERNE